MRVKSAIKTPVDRTEACIRLNAMLEMHMNVGHYNDNFNKRFDQALERAFASLGRGMDKTKKARKK